MNNSIFYINLDIHKAGVQSSINIVKDDSKRQIIFKLYDGQARYEIASPGCTAVLRAKKPDGTILFNNCAISDNTIIYSLTNQTSASAGVVECELTLYGTTNQQITSPRFNIVVADNLYSDSEVESQNQFTALAQAITATNNLNLQSQKTGKVLTVVVTKKDGTSSTHTITDGRAISSTTLNADYTLTLNFDDGTSYTTSSIRGEAGQSGVYVGSGPMPANCNVKIDPTGNVIPIQQTKGQSTTSLMSQKAITDSIVGVIYNAHFNEQKTLLTLDNSKTFANLYLDVNDGKYVIVRSESSDGAIMNFPIAFMQLDEATYSVVSSVIPGLSPNKLLYIAGSGDASSAQFTAIWITL